MALLTEALARKAASRTLSATSRSARSLLLESRESTRTAFDIFLSHSRLDSELILGVKLVLESTGRTVYVDWIDDPQLDRANVTPQTAEKLRQRMRQCRSLLYAHSSNSSLSRWMPWELGYFDAFNSNVAIFPVVQTDYQSSYVGLEYLGLYPYIDVTGRTEETSGTLYVHRSATEFSGFDRWLTAVDKLRPFT